MEFIEQAIEEYASKHSEKESDVLAALNRDTHAKVLQPRMLSGHLQGRILSMISKIHAPKRILEIGTYTGYSALCLAEGLTEGGELHTIDINEELEPMVSEFVLKAGFQGKVIQHIGNALEVIPKLNEKWDLVFIDADKNNYINYFDLVLPYLHENALIVFDNVLWSGKVLKETKQGDEDTRILKILNQKLAEDLRLETVMLPVRDGLTVCRLKSH